VRQPFLLPSKLVPVCRREMKTEICLCVLAFSLLVYAGSNVRLTNGDKTGDGRVEVSVGGQWGLVCGDNFDKRSAHVVCKQLGYSEDATVNTNRLEHDGLPFLIGNVRCSGVEDSIFDCEYNSNPTCTSKKVADVTCGETPVEATGSLGRTAGIIAALVMCFVAIIGIGILLVGCLWRNDMFGCCGGANNAV